MAEGCRRNIADNSMLLNKVKFAMSLKLPPFYSSAEEEMLLLNQVREGFNEDDA